MKVTFRNVSTYVTDPTICNCANIIRWQHNYKLSCCSICKDDSAVTRIISICTKQINHPSISGQIRWLQIVQHIRLLLIFHGTLCTTWNCLYLRPVISIFIIRSFLCIGMGRSVCVQQQVLGGHYNNTLSAICSSRICVFTLPLD